MQPLHEVNLQSVHVLIPWTKMFKSQIALANKQPMTSTKKIQRAPQQSLDKDNNALITLNELLQSDHSTMGRCY